MEKKITVIRNEQRKKQMELDRQYLARRVALAGYPAKQEKLKEQYEKATEAIEDYSNYSIHMLFDQEAA